ncbi:putative glutamate receptor [Babylonia areolata]|uniref:putative glutamate receptor n=1 Tax=Babylonia areolata TaxID=304850 RepID=UPI003FD1B985
MEANTTDCGQGQHPCYDFATIIDPPYVMEREDGSGQYEGLVVDLLHKLAHKIGFRFRLKVASGTYGHLEPNGTWTGLIGSVNTLPADMVVGAMAVTPERAHVLQLTESFHSSSVQLLLLRPTGEAGPGAGLLLAPFTPSAWLLVALAFVLVSVGLFLIGRFTLRKKARAPMEDKHRVRGFGLRDSFLFTVSTLTWQGYRVSPKSLSGRVVAVSWWLFAVLVLLAYVSNLTALVSLRPHLRPALPFRTYRDILRDKSMQLGTVRHGDAHHELKTSDDTLLKQLMEYVTSRHNLFQSLPEALQRMRQSPQDRLALLVPTYKARHVTSYQCDLISHGHGLGMIHYAFGMPAGNHLEPMKRRINTAIMVLRETGELEELSRKWQNKGSYCPDPEGSSLPVTLEGGGSSLPFMPLGPRDLAVAFLALVSCGLLAAVLAVVEVVHVRTSCKREQKGRRQPGPTTKPLYTKGEETDPDVVVILEGAGDSSQGKSGKSNSEKPTNSVCSDIEDKEKAAGNKGDLTTDETTMDVGRETTSGYHDVTVHQAA